MVSVQLKPTKMQPNDAVVTIQLRSDQSVPTKLQSARLVSHLSQEMSRVWNSGYLLHRIGRRFKQLIRSDKIETGNLFRILNAPAGQV